MTMVKSTFDPESICYSVFDDILNTNDRTFNCPNGSRADKKPTDDLKRNSFTDDKGQLYEKADRSSSVLSYESDTSLRSITTTTSRASVASLTGAQSEKLCQRIENEYDALERSEACYCYYISDRSVYTLAYEKLKHTADGTYFVRPAEETERKSNIEYFICFVCQKQVAQVPICHDKETRVFWFLSGCGHGSEVRRLYTGIDLIIRHKQENNFNELEYPFKISLYRSIDPSLAECSPLPDEVRAVGCQDTILHELAAQGLIQYFNELMRMSKIDHHFLQQKSLYIAKKINGRNKHGLTPLILAIKSKKYEFVDILLENNVDVNMTDSQGCSPLHHACRQANPRLLKKLLACGANPHYFNARETTDGTYQSNVAAFHYLAMSKGATIQNITRCAKYLLKCGCPLMPLTHDGKTPFDIAQMFNNDAYFCVKIFCNRYQFNHLHPIEVSSRNDAKNVLKNLISPTLLGKVRSRFKQIDVKDFYRNDGLFLLYKTKKTKAEPNGEHGLCVYYSGQIFVYPIAQKYSSSIGDPSNSSRTILYKYSLITDTLKDQNIQMMIFKSCEELIYNHTKYKGILPTTLNYFVRQDNNEITTLHAETLLLCNDQPDDISDDEESDADESGMIRDIDVTSIDSIDVLKIDSAKVLFENRNRIIWHAKVRLDDAITIPIVIKDYLPNIDVALYKKYRLKQFKSLSQIEAMNVNDELSYEHSKRAHFEYERESIYLLQDLKKHPLIVHTFFGANQLKTDLLIFMEYLKMGNLHSYLLGLKADGIDPLINAYHWIYQIAQAMAFLSSQKIVHRDLATRNVLLYNETHIKLTDFGLSRREDTIPEDNDFLLPVRWCAPECFDRTKNVLSLSDVWSFGILMWEIYSFGAIPYEADTRNNSQQLIRLLKRFLVDQGRRLSRPEQCSESVYDLMCRCWNSNIVRRPSFLDIVNELNGTSILRDRIVPFSREEKKAWAKAKDEFLMISQSFQIPAATEDHYIMVKDNDEMAGNELCF